MVSYLDYKSENGVLVSKISLEVLLLIRTLPSRDPLALGKSSLSDFALYRFGSALTVKA